MPDTFCCERYFQRINQTIAAVSHRYGPDFRVRQDTTNAKADRLGGLGGAKGAFQSVWGNDDFHRGSLLSIKNGAVGLVAS
jgi:hypothetical protein